MATLRGSQLDHYHQQKQHHNCAPFKHTVPQPLSPLSPAEGFESLPSATPSNHRQSGLTLAGEQDDPSSLVNVWTHYQPQIPPSHPHRGVYFESGEARGIELRPGYHHYPSPPSTSSNPTHPVSLPRETPTGDSGGDLGYDLPPIAKTCLYFGGVLDSPLLLPRIATMPLSAPSRPALTFTDSDTHHSTVNPTTRMGRDLSSCSPLFALNDEPPHSTFHSAGDLDSLSPLSPEWESNELTGYDSLSIAQPTLSDLGPLLDSDDEEDRFSMGLSTFADDASSSSTRPILPLLDIPGTGFHNTKLHSYAPSPSSPLWLAEEYPLHSSVGGEQGGDGDGDDFVVSPPSSGPPDTPSPSSSPIFPSLGDLGDDDEVDEEGKDVDYWEDSNAISGYFPHPSSPSIRTHQFLPDFDYTNPTNDYLDEDDPRLPHQQHEIPHEHFDYDYQLQQDDYNDYDLLRSPSFLRSFTDLPDTYEDVSPPTPPTPSTPDGLLLLLNDDSDGPSSGTGSSTPRSPSPELEVLIDSLALPTFSEHEEVQKLAGLQRRAEEAESVAREREKAAVEAALSAAGSASRLGKSGSSGVTTATGAIAGEEEESTAAFAAMEDTGNAASNVWQLQRAAADARSIAKKERERAREVGALLGLKLKEKGVNLEVAAGAVVPLPLDEEVGDTTDTDDLNPSTSTSSGAKQSHSPPNLLYTSSPSPALVRIPKKPRMTTVAQLVAKMLLNRHEAPSVPLSSPPPSSPSTSSSAPSPSRSSSRYRSLWLKGLAAAGGVNVGAGLGAGLGGLGGGATAHQPFLPYQQRYKFLRSSPLGRNSVVAPAPPSSFEALEVHDGRGIEKGEMDAHRTGGDVDDLFDDEDEDEGGFGALRTPIMWGLDGEKSRGDGLLPIL